MDAPAGRRQDYQNSLPARRFWMVSELSTILMERGLLPRRIARQTPNLPYPRTSKTEFDPYFYEKWGLHWPTLILYRVETTAHRNCAMRSFTQLVTNFLQILVL